MRQLIAGNWKMNLLQAEATALARGIAEGASGAACDLLVCPPFTALAAVGAALGASGVALGAQDCHAAPRGAFTGDVAAPMLADLGCTAVILGHSERRQGHHETSEAVCAKVRAAMACGLMPVVCVGESEAERDAGDAERIVCRQVADSLPKDFNGVLAYEPIWAIGSGRTATSQDVAAMHAAIRRALVQKLGDAGGIARILYGGSVNPGNAEGLLCLPEVGGALVGGASLEANAFLRIAAACRRG